MTLRSSRRRNEPHPLARGLTFLGVGLAANVLVAWGFAGAAEQVQFDPHATAQERRDRWAASDDPNALWLDRIWRSPGLRVRFLHEQGDRESWIVEHDAGWPLPAMRGRVLAPETPPTPGSAAPPPRFSAAVDLRSKLEMNLYIGDKPTPSVTDQTWKVLPFMPLWPGIVVNTLLCAAILCAIAGAFALVRGAYRRTRGRCPRCGYDLRGKLAAGCPECGWKRTRDAADQPVPSR